MKKINEFKEKLFDFTEKFASKTGDYAQITKLTMEIKSREAKMSSAFEKLGEYIYDHVSEETMINIDDEIKELKAAIDEHRRSMEEKIDEIHKLKSKESSSEEEENTESEIKEESSTEENSENSATETGDDTKED